MQYNYRTTGGVLLGMGILLLLLTVLDSLGILSQREVLPSPEDFWVSLTFVGLGFMALLGRTVSSLKGRFKDIEIDVHFESVVLQKVLDPELKEKRQEYAASRCSILPDRDAPSFQLLEEKMAITATPCTDLTIPMYMLDSNFRIIDWNSAFSLCFDRTMEGRRGMSVLEWTYFLDNYEQVLEHGIEAFSATKDLPRIDIEEIRYTSHRYGPISGTKRAYQIPNDDGSCLGWLITIEPKFQNKEMALRSQEDLFISLRQSLIWSEYALSYDSVLNNTEIYPHLLRTLLGEKQPGPEPIPAKTTILDLGAGTGNVTRVLAEPSAQRLIIAIDNNSMMLNILRRKCQPYLRQDANGSGVIAIKQDISSLYGLSDGFFDYVILNNVLYSLDDAAVNLCLSEVYRVLKPGGEVRISGPQKSTKLSKVLDQIKKDLIRNKRFDQFEKEYLRVKQINEYSLALMLLRWTQEEMETLLEGARFSSISYSTDDIYAGQSMLVCAQK
jgi:ubiquinone/menaquinone biosynthesis C-methylase UbiE/PAS domain-containing protein